MNNPANIGRYQFLTAASDDALLSEAARSFSEIRESVESLAGNKREYYSLYDIPGIDRIVNICHWGRSGSLLLASFLDNHDHVLMLPFHQGEKIYAFLSTYGHLPLWDQLIAYPTYARSLKGDSGDFFVKENELGNFAIEPTDYYAAVCAMADFHRGTLEPWMKSRVGFFRALHVVYAVALGRRPATARPIIVYAQHWPNDELAQCLVEDFPKAQFLHTVRDPLTAVGSWFDGNMDNYMYCYNERPEITPKYLDAATIAMVFLLTRDQGHPALAEVTRALRFEDMHLDPEGVMRRVATWLNIPYSGRLLESSDRVPASGVRV